MLTTLIAAAAVMSPQMTHVGCSDSCLLGDGLEPNIARIVEAAWQEQQKQEQKPDPKLTRAQQRHQEDLKNDVDLGKKYSEQADKELKPSENKEYIERVNRISSELSTIANNNLVKVLWGDPRMNTYNYVFKVVKEEEVNAFSLPGGFIYVYEGLLKYVESDDELAGVLAHEIAHASFRHLATLQREQSKVDVFTLPLILISLLAGGEGGASGLLLGNLANQALASGWGQNAERSADFGGFQYMSMSKYSPVGLLTFMERLARDQRAIESIDWGIYRTHPPSRERATLLEKYMREANVPIKRSQVTTSFRVTPKPAEDGKVPMQFNGRVLFTLMGADAKARSERLAPVLNDFFDAVPELYEVTLDASNTVIWNGRPLFELEESDVPEGQTLDQVSAAAVRSLKRELYMLAFRVWDAR